MEHFLWCWRLGAVKDREAFPRGPRFSLPAHSEIGFPPAFPPSSYFFHLHQYHSTATNSGPTSALTKR